MRRAILAVLATAVGLVLLLSFKPHEVTSLAERPAAVTQGDDGTAGGSGEGSGDGFFGRDRDHDDDHDDDHDEFDDGDGDRFGGSSSGAAGSSGASGSSKSSGAAGSSNPTGSWTGQGATAGATSGDKTVTGDSADTRWGPVQVAIVVSGGKMAGIKVLDAPANNHRDIRINNEALPILNDEALSAKSAQIDTVSGATYTSDGYTRSLQSALDKAGL
ncbi:FMN-binding protein [Microbispora catharanthi]|uniref:FMN-binding protein n=1 Tax=Microbispora catharanthi TaxID=1712871 RepID=A0A5N6BX33_9ACTN|nr:FMN-binding protein [Microbispora catharanthi]KAB8185076.1 FMN-binding protein [Microbispora catharanthi]